MSIELPFAPVDAIIRRNAGGLRVGSEATEELARLIQIEGANIAMEAAEVAKRNGRKTIHEEDFKIDGLGIKKEIVLPIAPIDRIARSEIDDRYRIGSDARLILAEYLENYADEKVKKSAILARHAGRKTIQKEDVEVCIKILRGLKEGYAG